MEHTITTVNWQNSLLLKRTPVIFDIPYQKVDIFSSISGVESNKSFLHSTHKLKSSILDEGTEKVVLNVPPIEKRPQDDQAYEKCLISGHAETRKLPSKKISFKIKKQSSLYKRVAINRVTNIPANKVAELTKKFNEMVEKQNLLEEQRIKMIVKRENSLRSDCDKPKRSLVCRKPSVKTKPTADNKNLVIIKTKPVRKNSLKKQSSEKSIIKTTENPQPVVKKPKEPLIRPNTLNLNLNIPKAIIETSPGGTSVRAAIEIFEKKSAEVSPIKEVVKTPSIKPQVPEKSEAVKNIGRTATLPPSLRKNHESLSNLISNDSLSKDVIQKSSNDKNNIKDNKMTEFAEDQVEIINIPAVLPQRRCDSMYETLNLKKITTNTGSIKSKSVDSINKRVKVKPLTPITPNSSFLWRCKSPTTVSSYSWINAKFEEKLNQANTPEMAKKLPPDIPPKPSTPTKILKKKLPLPDTLERVPDEKTKKEPDDDLSLPEYEEIGYHIPVSPEEITHTEEKFKGYDEITKPVNDVEVLETKELPEKHYEEIGSKICNYEEINGEEKMYEELPDGKNDDGYEPIGNSSNQENIYETLPVPPVPLRRQQQEPLPPRPPSTTKPEDGDVYNCYESIYTESKKDVYYESIYGSQLTDSGSNRDSVLSSDHKSNSLYGKSLPMWDYSSDPTYYKPPSDISSSDRVSERSDEWEDVTDNDEEENRIIIIREKPKGKKSGWSQHFREQLSKSIKEQHQQSQFGEDNDHHYESLCSSKEEEFDYDSFESDTESEDSFDKLRIVDDSGIDVSNSQLPEPPNSQGYGLIKFAGKHMRKIKRNLTLDITKSLTRMKKHMSKTDGDISNAQKEDRKSSMSKPKLSTSTYENMESKQIIHQEPEVDKTPTNESQSEEPDKSKTLRKGGGFLTKFRRSMSLSAESAHELTSNLNGNKTRSTFYLTETIDVDNMDNQGETVEEKSLLRKSRSPITRPNSPPPPAPVSRTGKSNRKDGKSSSWYADAGLFRNSDTNTATKRPNTFWYAEVGLYQSQTSSPPSTSSAENSGSNLSTPIKPFEIPRPVLKPSDFINQDDNEKYNNLKNENTYYPESCSSIDTKKDESLIQDIQLRLLDEPLYQFYDAAVLESISYGDTSSDFDSDNYEDISEKGPINQIKIRPSAMELVSPKRNSICFTKTLWCEIPEVINSSVLSTLSTHQKKLQEAKFEILTSEASYLNSLNVLCSHFVKNFNAINVVSKDEKQTLFGRVEEVRNSSEKLLHDLEKCWQDNILLHGICDIVQKHAEENFNVYIPYCENQVLFDETLKILKERLGFTEFLKHLELNEACQSLSLYSFLMLPMQRITRWPLLIDAVLKRLPPQDPEYYSCQFALATVNKIVNQCNEAARTREREMELKRITTQLEFPSNVPQIPIFSTDRWLIRCGTLTHIQTRNDDNKLTFGKRFSKSSIYLFLFNDLLIVTKERSENNYTVQHYCLRNLVELSTTKVNLAVPTKEVQSKNLIFLTILENQDGKTIEYLSSCNSESDKERWIEALTPPKSEDPDETLYEYWDCPQVSAIHNYSAVQPDELALTKGDVINVRRKMADGWYHGEKIRDGQIGWFPANHTLEIANVHVRARNLKQRYRLLAFSENYLKTK